MRKKLTKLWNDWCFNDALNGIYMPSPVRNELQKRGWQFKVHIFATPTMFGLMGAHIIEVCDRDGRPCDSDPIIKERYERDRIDVVCQYYNNPLPRRKPPGLKPE